MRLPPPVAALCLSVAACSPFAAPDPVGATLTRDLLSVSMSDGQRCLGPRPQTAGPEGWSGRLSGCSVAYPYAVRIDPDPNILRQAVEAVFSVLHFEDALAPMAEVEVTGPRGRVHVFASPPPFED